MDNVSGHIKQLYDSAIFTLTSIGGTANAVTGTLDPTLDSGGLVGGMGFWFKATSTNTGAMTLTVSGAPTFNLISQEGAALVAGQVVTGGTYLVQYDGAVGMVYGAGPVGGLAFDVQVFTVSGTWTKPTGLDPNHQILIEAWGGGGGGGLIGGGGGGAYVARRVLASQVAPSVSVTVGAGGATGDFGTAGGASIFGGAVTAFGGGGGGNTATNSGGGGGTSWAAGLLSGGIGGDAPDIWRGGDGGDGVTGPTSAGGRATMGGGGGEGNNGTTVGISTFGGNGGSQTLAGAAPGGGGGQGAAGARGEVRVLVI